MEFHWKWTCSLRNISAQKNQGFFSLVAGKFQDPFWWGIALSRILLIVPKPVLFEKFQIFTKILIFILFPSKTTLKCHNIPSNGKGKAHTAPTVNVLWNISILVQPLMHKWLPWEHWCSQNYIIYLFCWSRTQGLPRSLCLKGVMCFQ